MFFSVPSLHGEYYCTLKNIFKKNERRCRDIKTQTLCENGREVNVGAKIKQTISYISTALCTLLYSISSSTYVGLYGSGLFNFWVLY